MNKFSSEESQISEESSNSEEQLKLLKVAKKKKIKNNKILINIASNNHSSDTKYSVIKSVAKTLKWKLQLDPDALDWDVFWTENAVQAQFLGKMQAHQKINHFPGMYSLSRKNNLAKNLIAMKKKFKNLYSFFPQTWMLPVDFNQFRFYYESIQKFKQKTFIVKPEASCQGKGIFLTKNITDIDPQDHCVVQKYITKPYLIEQLKFDLRIYVLLAGIDPLKIFVYNEGLGRFATEQYQNPKLSNMENLCMHLTNYAINKQNPNFIFNDSVQQMDTGHKRSLSSVYSSMEKDGVDLQKLKNQIYQIIIKTFIPAVPNIRHHYKSSHGQINMCFQILGFDVIIDSKLKPYLLQINQTPSFATDTPLDKHIKKSLILQTFKLMNINQKNKSAIIAKKQKEIEQRMITGKKKKVTLQQKMEEKQLYQKQLAQYEQKNMGSFTKIFPLENNKDKYNQLLKYAEQLYMVKTGFRAKNNELVKGNTKLITNPQQKKSIFQKKEKKKPKLFKKMVSSKYLEHMKKKSKEIQEVQRMELPKIKKEEKDGVYIKPRNFEIGELCSGNKIS